MSWPQTINGNTYTEAMFLNRGYVTALPALTEDMATVAGEVQTNADQVALDEIQTNADAATCTTKASEASVSAATAVAAASAASKGIPFVTTSGSSTAYTADFTPDLSGGDGELFSLDIHTANTSTSPTLAIDGGSAKSLVALTGRSLAVGELYIGANITVSYDGENDRYEIQGGLPLRRLENEVDANGNNLVNVRGYQRQVVVHGEISDGLLTRKMWFDKATRIFKSKPFVRTGTVTVVVNHNGSDDIGWDDPTDTEIDVTSTPTEVEVNEDSNAYFDVAAGDYLQFTFSAASSAEDFIMPFETQENYS